MTRILAAAAVVATLAAGVWAPAQAAPQGQPEPYLAAQAHYEVGHYPRAFEMFARLADQGHCESARIARQMAALGRKLYPVDFVVDAERLQRWQHITACPLATASR